MSTHKDNNKPTGHLDALDWDMAPSKDLWPSIKASIEAEAAEHAPEPAPAVGKGADNVVHVQFKAPAWMSAAMAACLIVAVGSMSVSYYAMQRNEQYLELQAQVLMQHQETIQAIDAQHQQVKTRLVALLSSPENNLSPTLVSEAQEIMNTTEAASLQIKQAIENAPDKQGYLKMLVETYQREAELLNRIKLGQELSI